MTIVLGIDWIHTNTSSFEQLETFHPFFEESPILENRIIFIVHLMNFGEQWRLGPLQ